MFDNSDGKLAGQYAGYTEVSLKRVVSRDGTFDYFLNGARCRRKDITQLFLGTGLGSRSYAIIEQGMISRVIEARPEELRALPRGSRRHLQVQGAPQAKPRPASRTPRENLERLSDVREEVDKQLRHLQRQAATARRYQALKQEERKLTAELLALRLRVIEQDSQSKEGILRERDTAMQALIADLRAIEASIESAREDFTEKSEALNGVQGRYYQIGAEISRAEQSIQHGRELRQRQRQDLEQAEQGATEANLHLDARPVADRRAARRARAARAGPQRGARARTRFGRGARPGRRVDAGLAGALGRASTATRRPPARRRRSSARASSSSEHQLASACQRSANGCRPSCRS